MEIIHIYSAKMNVEVTGVRSICYQLDERPTPLTVYHVTHRVKTE